MSDFCQAVEEGAAGSLCDDYLASYSNLSSQTALSHVTDVLLPAGNVTSSR